MSKQEEKVDEGTVQERDGSAVQEGDGYAVVMAIEEGTGSAVATDKQEVMAKITKIVTT